MNDQHPDRDQAPMSVEQIRARQRARAKVMAWLLVAFVALIFAIAIVRIQGGIE
jgi:hypothetical protein